MADNEITWVNPFDTSMEGISHNTFFSQTIKTEVGYSIYTPTGYNECRDKYPLIYWLHGKGGDESTGPLYGIARFLHEAIISGRLPPSIMVFPNGAGYSMFSDSFDGKIPVETIIIKELIPYIDKNYRTTASRSGRGLEGFSMGGNGALKLAFKFPELFCSVISYGGSFHDLESVSKGRPKVFKEIFGNKCALYQKNNVFELAALNRRRIRGKINLKFVVGTQDFTISNNLRLFRLLDTLKIGYRKEILEGFQHIVEPYYRYKGVENFKLHFKC